MYDNYGEIENSSTCGEIWNWWGFIAIYAVLLLNLFIHAVLSRNLFCHNLRAFLWREIEPESTFVEIKLQIWGLLETPYFHNGGPLPMVTKLLWAPKCKRKNFLSVPQEDHSQAGLTTRHLKVGLKDFCKHIYVSLFLSQSLPPGALEKRWAYANISSYNTSMIF